MNTCTKNVKKIALLGLLVALGLSGCQSSSTQKYSNQEDPNARMSNGASDFENLADFLRERKIPFARNGNKLFIQIPDRIHFKTDSARVMADASDPLVQIAVGMSYFPQTKTTVIGHTDSTGKAGYNYQLADRRAYDIAYVFAINGIDASRITTRSAGQNAPVASNKTVKGKALNRRADIVLEPLY